MIRLLALALALGSAGGLLPALPQDDLGKKIDEIIPRLSDDSIDVRDRAVKELVELGAPAIPLLKSKAASLGEEVRGRLLEACARIESRNLLAKVLPPLKRVTLDWDNKPARDAFEEIGRLAGLALDLSSGGFDAAISFSVKNATPLEALDEACRKAGVTWRSADDDFFGRRRNPAPVAGPRIMIQNGKAVDYPTGYARHYRFRVTQVSLTKTNSFQANTSNAQISLDLAWAPDVKPDAMQSFKISEITDDQGRSLLVDDNDPRRARFRGMRGRYRGRDMGSYSQYVTIKYPEADAKRIATLKGTAVMSFPQEVKTLSFEKPAEAQGKALELNGLTVTLKEYRATGRGHSMTIEITGKFQGAGDAADDDDGFSNLPFSYEDVELITESGESLHHNGMSGSGDGKSYKWTLDYSGDKGGAAKEVRISCVLRRFNDEVGFEIKDIALPK